MKPPFENLQSALELADRLGDVPGHHEHALHARLADEPGEVVLEKRRALGAPRHDVGDRLHAFLAKPGRKGDRLVRLGAGHVRDVELRARAHEIPVPLDAGRLADGGLD